MGNVSCFACFDEDLYISAAARERVIKNYIQIFFQCLPSFFNHFGAFVCFFPEMSFGKLWQLYLDGENFTFSLDRFS